MRWVSRWEGEVRAASARRYATLSYADAERARASRPPDPRDCYSTQEILDDPVALVQLSEFIAYEDALNTYAGNGPGFPVQIPEPAPDPYKARRVLDIEG